MGKKRHAIGAGLVLLTIAAAVAVGPRVAEVWRRAKRAHHHGEVTTLQTARYTLTYPKIFTKPVAKLAAGADELHDRITALLGGTWEGPIPVRFTELDGLGGQTVDRNILLGFANEDTSRAMLAHETVHVYLNQLTRGALQRHRSSTMLFNEGAAMYVAARLLEQDPGPARLMVASCASKTKVRLDALLEGQGAIQELGSQVAYPLGQLFVAALVEEHGDSALGKIARAMGDVDARDAGVVAASFQAAQLDFERVARRFDSRLAATAAEQMDALSRFPRLVGRIILDKGRILVRIESTAELQGFIKVCRLRAVAPSTRARPELHLEDDCAAEAGHFAQDRFEYQLCWAGMDGLTDICEPYVDATIGRELSTPG